MMKKRLFVNLLSAFFFTWILSTASPLMAQEFPRGTQLALQGFSAEDAETATNDNSSPSTQPEINTSVQKDNAAQNLEQEMKELKEEIKKIRDENEARKKLEVPEEEKGKTIDDILSAVGRQYSLLKQGTISLSYLFNYSYYSGDAINDASVVERRSNHNLTNTIITEYALRNNLTLSANFPFAYKYNKLGTAASQDATDWGDISLSTTFEPFLWENKSLPTTIFSIGVSLPTGTSPYKIDLNHSLATGAGYYSVNGSVSLSKVLDPLVAFGSLSYNYGFPAEGLSQYWNTTQTLTKVDPGSTIGAVLGFGYALSYQASLNMGVQLAYSFDNKYTVNNSATYENGSYLSSVFNIGTGWRISASRSIYVSLGIGLTVNDPDVSLSFKVPFEF